MLTTVDDPAARVAGAAAEVDVLTDMLDQARKRRNDGILDMLAEGHSQADAAREAKLSRARLSKWLQNLGLGE